MNGWLASSDLFDMLTQSSSIIHSITRIKSTNVIHQIGIKNEWLLLPASFEAKFGLVFVLTLENAFLRGFVLKPTESASVLGICKIALRLRRFVTISENFRRFQYFNFETNFLENENLFLLVEEH